MDIADKTECFGCMACADICPKKAIKMELDNEGFRYPVIDGQLCIECGLCDKVCPKHFIKFHDKKYLTAFVGAADEEIVFHSASGGAFTAIYESLIPEGYYIYGAKFNDKLQVVHEGKNTASECEAFRKSKYIQSNMNGIYSEINERLKKGEKVLFSGTPCQCAALRSFLKLKNRSDEGLIVVDVLCHGISNQVLFDAYIKEIEEKHNKGKVVRYNFKQKTPINGVFNSRSVSIEFENKERLIADRNSDAFINAYYSRLAIRPSCGKCRFACEDRVSDITISDAWKISQQYPDLDPLKGVSLIMTHTPRGVELSEKMKLIMQLNPIDNDWAINSQKIMHEPTWMNANREKFFELWEHNSFSYCVKKALHVSFYKRVYFKLRAEYKKLLKKR